MTINICVFVSLTAVVFFSGADSEKLEKMDTKSFGAVEHDWEAVIRQHESKVRVPVAGSAYVAPPGNSSRHLYTTWTQSIVRFSSVCFALTLLFAALVLLCVPMEKILSVMDDLRRWREDRSEQNRDPFVEPGDMTRIYPQTFGADNLEGKPGFPDVLRQFFFGRKRVTAFPDVQFKRVPASWLDATVHEMNRRRKKEHDETQDEARIQHLASGAALKKFKAAKFVPIYSAATVAELHVTFSKHHMVVTDLGLQAVLSPLKADFGMAAVASKWAGVIRDDKLGPEIQVMLTLEYLKTLSPEGNAICSTLANTYVPSLAAYLKDFAGMQADMYRSALLNLANSEVKSAMVCVAYDLLVHCGSTPKKWEYVERELLQRFRPYCVGMMAPTVKMVVQTLRMTAEISKDF